MAHVFMVWMPFLPLPSSNQQFGKALKVHKIITSISTVLSHTWTCMTHTPAPCLFY